MITGLFVIFLVMTGLFIALALRMKRRIKTGFEDWIKQYSLNYEKEVVTNTFINSIFFNTAAISFTNVTWGLYKNKRIYLFNVIDSSGLDSDKKMFFNGNFYSKIKVEDIDKLIENQNYLTKRNDVFGSCIDIEIPQLLTANVFLKYGNKIKFLVAKRIYTLLEKFADSKVKFGDEIMGVLSGNSWKIDMKFNDEDVIDFVTKNYSDVDKETIRQIADVYEDFSLKYDRRRIKSDDSLALKDIDMSKFR